MTKILENQYVSLVRPRRHIHAQQAVEKYLKAVIAVHGLDIPRTHDLEEIQLICIELIQDVAFKNLELEELSDYAVSVRYDFEFWPDVNIAAEAVDVADQVRLFTIEAVDHKNT